MKTQETQNSQNNLEIETKVGKVILSNYKTQYKSTISKTTWDWHKDRHVDQQNRIVSQE